MRGETGKQVTSKPLVIFEDETLLILDKPARWVVNDATTTKAPTIQSWLSKNFKYNIAKSREFRSGIVHRLDKDTSGLLLIAKNEKSFYELQKQFKERRVQKEYTALLHGKVESKSGEVDAPVGRLPWKRERFGVLAGGREAYTSYRVSDFFENKETKEVYSLVDFYPKTGRTHQIRIHTKHIGHPIVADTFYAGRKTARNDLKWCSRLFLHAQSIEFTHPKTEEKKKFVIGLPRDLQNALQSLAKI